MLQADSFNDSGTETIHCTIRELEESSHLSGSGGAGRYYALPDSE